MKGRGELDILFPAFTAFHRFSAQTDRLDLRHAGGDLSRLSAHDGDRDGERGTRLVVARRPRLNANLTHTDGPAEPTHMTGGGRVTYGEKFMTYAPSRCRPSRSR